MWAVKVTLISPYEIGRQPFGLAQPAAWLDQAGFEVWCLDLSQQMLKESRLKDAGLIGIYVAMHTATRIAVEAIKRIREINPNAALMVYGLYAPMNRELFEGLGAVAVFGGESEPDIVALAEAVRDGTEIPESVTRLERIQFVMPDRRSLPSLDQYASLVMPDDSQKMVAFAETTRGCKHLCRHCPVVPVYEGSFRTIPVDIVIDDIAGQVQRGATHVSFGDPDFLNGPGHARRVLKAMHDRFPQLTFDATVKVEHILKHESMLAELKSAGCLFLTTAVESVDDEVLANLEKGHTAADFEIALSLLRSHGIAMAPTFVPFTPWTSVESYRALLERVASLGLIEAVAPVQLSIRLLIPKGSWMLRIEGFEGFLDDFDQQMLGYPWQHTDPAVDALQQKVMDIAMQGEDDDLPRQEIFERIWQSAWGDEPAPALASTPSDRVPALSEPWYCCAEPTEAQITSI